jgi:hypothetical protein
VTEPWAAMTRRTLLRLLGGGTLAALGLDAGPAAGAADAESASTAAAALARVGRRYLEAVPAERDVTVLRAELGELAAATEPARHAAALERAVGRDFERGDILALDGWILSRTELRAAALFALTTPPAP